MLPTTTATQCWLHHMSGAALPAAAAARRARQYRRSPFGRRHASSSPPTITDIGGLEHAPYVRLADAVESSCYSYLGPPPWRAAGQQPCLGVRTHACQAAPAHANAGSHIGCWGCTVLTGHVLKGL